MEDAITIAGLEVQARIGVPLEEREAPQRLTLWLRLIPGRGVEGLGEEIARTIDYAVVAEAMREEAEARPRKLLETLACDLARVALAQFPLRAVEVEVRKYILPGTEYVAVSIRRERAL